VQRGQVFAVFNGMFSALEDLFHGKVCQGFQPELLDLVELLGIRKGCVILIVVVQPKQGEDLIDRLGMGCAIRRGGVIWPRRCP
jgi:hypothetical protein